MVAPRTQMDGEPSINPHNLILNVLTILPDIFLRLKVGSQN